MSKDEAMKEVLSAEDYHWENGGKINTFDEIMLFVESYAQYREQLYLKSKLNEVTDEVILRKYPKANGQDALHPDRLRAYGAKWLLKHLKRTES